MLVKVEKNMPKHQQPLTFRGKHQDTLDSALEEEFVKTIEVFDDYVNQYDTVDQSWKGKAIPLDQFEDLKSRRAETHGSTNKGRQRVPKEYNLDDLPDIKYKINLRADKLRDESASPVKVDMMNSVSSENSRLKHKHFHTQVNSRVNS